MKKLLAILFIFLFLGNCYSQDAYDTGTPANPTFDLGSDIQGTIQNSVNESTGKVTLSTPLASIAANSVSYNIGLTYNGQASFKNGQQTNKYNPTSIVGVGWSMGTPKIIVDNKGTGTRDDDDFYLLDGATNTKLTCSSRGTTANGSQWEFQMEKYAPWKIYFYHHTGWGDYWKIVKDDGLTYYFGNLSTKDGKEFSVRYGNWIGSSKQYGATSEQTIVWNITKIEDQWLNNLSFTYDMVKQTMSGKDQTEASYLKKVTSSNGASIQLTYALKNTDEFFEPHQESIEPDAYQERYEKMYLQSVSSYNNSNDLVSLYNLGYTLNGTGLNKKRYLTSLTQTSYNNGSSEILPAQSFEYNYTGTFQGGIKKINYPAGGSVTYTYDSKTLFSNDPNQFEEGNIIAPSGYIYHSAYVSDNYGIYAFRTQNIVSGDKYRFIFYRVWWNGEKWEWEDFIFPHLIPDPDYANQGGALKDFYAVFEKDFYGFAYDKGTTADIYLYHLNQDGRTWDSYITTNKSIGSENPTFVSGDGFAALQSHRGGELYTYVWNGSYWNYKRLLQGGGQYYNAAKNNFIVSLDEDGGADMVTGVVHEDNYYLHYLDAENNWQTKSWSAYADPRIYQISEASFWYPDNSIIGFMADNNPELFFRWDTNYNLINIDNVMGGYNDSYPMVPVGNSMFTIYDSWYKHPYKSARFNGVNWKVEPLPSSNISFQPLSFGEDVMLYKHPMFNGGVGYQKYDPNGNIWSAAMLDGANSTRVPSSINRDFAIAGNIIYSRTPQGNFSPISTLQYDLDYTFSDGLEHAFVKEDENGYERDGYYYYMNKNSGQLVKINVGRKKHMNSKGDKLGGYQSFMSPKTMWLEDYNGAYFHRIIDDKINNTVYDIVVNHIDINDDNGSLKKILYTYNNPKNTFDNSSTYYGEVVIENKGLGTGNIGKIIKLFDNGATDQSMAGLPLEVLTVDANNKVVKRKTLNWNKYLKYSPFSYYIKQTAEKEELFFNDSPNVVIEKAYTYDSYGLKKSSSTTDSKGVTVKQDMSYAYQYYSFVNDKNMLSFPYQTTTKVNNQIVNVVQSKWINDNGKVYLNENWSGPSTSSLRLNSQISKVEPSGNVLESNNGKGFYNTVLFGYDNLYEVATVSNSSYSEVINELEVTYAQLQNLTSSNLKVELLKLYEKLPNVPINLSFYDTNGRVVSRINERKEESFIYYDTLGRVDYITNSKGNVLEKKNYHFSN